MRTGGVICLAVSLLLVGCGSSLASDDPAGYEACRIYADALRSDDPLVRIAGPIFEVGRHASEAKTEAIRDAVEPLTDPTLAEEYGMPDTWSVDREALTAACEASGVEIP